MCQFHQAISVDKLDIYASTDDARTVRLDHALSVAQASAMRGGDQILLSTKTGSYTCLMTLKGDAAAGNTLQGTAAPLGFDGPTASVDTNACRVPMAGRVLSIDASEAVTFAGVHGLGVGDLVMLTGLAGGGAGLVEGEVYKVKTVSSTTVVVLEGGADATILMASIGTRYYATAAVSAAYTGANATVVARKVSSVSNSGVVTFASASHGSTVGQSYYIHSMTGGVGGSAQIRGIGGVRTDVPRPIAVQDLGASATTTATGATTWSAASPTAIAISSAVTSAHAVVGTAVHFIATPTGATHPRVYSKYGHSFGTGDKVVFSELRAHAAPLSGTSVTITADCTAADPALCTTSGSVDHGLSTGDRLRCTSDGTGGGTAPLKVENAVTYIVTVVDEDTFSLVYAYCSPGGSCSPGTEPGNAVEVGTGTQTGVVFTVPGGGLQAGKTYTVGGTWKDTNGDNYINTAAVAADEFAAGTMTAATGAIAVGSDPGWVAGDVLMASTVASAASGIAVDDLYVVTSNSGSVVMLETLDGNAIVKWKGDATVKFLKVPYFELTGDDGGTITMTEPYMAAGSGALLHPVGHDKPLDKLYVFTAHMLQYEGIVTNGDQYGGVGGLKDAQSVTARTGAIVVESLGSQAKDLSQGIFPGDWVRVYDPTSAGGYYCDCEVNAQPTTDSGISCATDTMSSHYMSTVNLGGCEDRSGQSYALAHLSRARVIDVVGAGGVIYPATQDKTVLIEDDYRVSGSYRVTWSINFLSAHLPLLQPGAVVMVTNSIYGVLCAGTVTVAPASATSAVVYITKTAPAGSYMSACATQSATAGALVSQGTNGVYFSDEDMFNANKFKGVAAGDAVRVSGSRVGTFGSDETFIVSSIDAENSATMPSSLFFRVGVAPKGQGMYPMIAHNGGFVGSRVATSPGLPMDTTAIVQMARTKTFDWTNGTGASSPESLRVKQVLEDLPNHAVDTVDVVLTSAGLHLYAYTITYSGPSVTGDQQNIIMNVDGCSIDGCQPRFTGLNTQVGYMSDSDGHVTATAITSAGDGVGGFSLATELATGGGGDDVIVYTGTATVTTSSKGTKYTTTAASDTSLAINGGTADDPSLGLGIIVLNKNVGNDLIVRGDQKYFQSETFEIIRGTAEATECSGRGFCNVEKGHCECFRGYEGNACATQSALV